MRYVWLGFILPLAACSFLSPITGGNEIGGTVNFVATRYGEDDAMEAARDHCAKYDRIARKLRNDFASNTLTFTCEVRGKPMQ